MASGPDSDGGIMAFLWRNKIWWLTPAIAVLLVYVGVKMLFAHWYHLPTVVSLSFIVLVMTVAIVASVVKDRRTSLR